MRTLITLIACLTCLPTLSCLAADTLNSETMRTPAGTPLSVTLTFGTLPPDYFVISTDEIAEAPTTTEPTYSGGGGGGSDTTTTTPTTDTSNTQTPTTAITAPTTTVVVATNTAIDTASTEIPTPSSTTQPTTNIDTPQPMREPEVETPQEILAPYTSTPNLTPLIADALRAIATPPVRSQATPQKETTKTTTPTPIIPTTDKQASATASVIPVQSQHAAAPQSVSWSDYLGLLALLAGTGIIYRVSHKHIS